MQNQLTALERQCKRLEEFSENFKSRLSFFSVNTENAKGQIDVRINLLRKMT